MPAKVKELDYVYLRAWDRMMGSSAEWQQGQLERARSDNAPADAVYHDGKNWRRFASVTRPDTRTYIETLVDWIRKGN